MKRIVSIIFLALSTMAQEKSQNFELWNKHNEPIYYSISNSLKGASRKTLELLKPGKFAKNIQVTITKPTFVTLSIAEKPIKGQSVDVYKIAPHKKIFLRVGLLPETRLTEFLKWLLGKTAITTINEKNPNKSYIFGPQTGPLIGARGITEQGHQLDEQVAKLSDIEKISIKFQGN